MSFFSRRRKVHLSNHRTVDSPLGPIRISYSNWPGVIVAVQSPQMPIVTVLPDRDIGAMAINKQAIPCEKADRNGWNPSRKAQTRTALVGDRAYELRPTGLRRAQLSRNGEILANAWGSWLAYSPFRAFPGLGARLSWAGWADATDVAIGQSMVVAYGAGAPGAIAAFLGLLSGTD
ncbi:hypothetical protein J2Z21_005734 [Streptomyces griseochromogenes]|uniref:Uncharacterized protein n=1 Tax=Streptomyces griseochromogenes TaxID=68214 RepID=A0ABS4LZA8_9ACTN|nr:hypothetical protein [Streptomyces griseochromogenes]MBP2052747.1 hypothetical protein [Streptomyces griseochromogenes]